MPLDTNILQRLSPAGGLAPMQFGLDDTSMERERLKLLREQFEETKRNNQRDDELRRLEEAGRMAREQLLNQRAQDEAEAAAKAKLTEQRQAAMTEFTKLNGAGNIEGARAMVPMMSQLGMKVDLEGEVNGLPRYRVLMNPEEEAQQAPAVEPMRSEPPEGSVWLPPEVAQDESLQQSLTRLGGLGYPTDDSGTMAPPMGIGGSSDMTPEQLARVTGGGTADRELSDALNAEEFAPLEVEPDIGPPTADADTDLSPIKPEFRDVPRGLDPLAALRAEHMAPVAPSEPDYTGAVPKNVIDMSAIQAQTLARLDPALGALVNAYPEQYRESAGQTAAAVRGLGLPAEKAVEAFGKGRSSPDSLIQAGIQADAAKEAAGAKTLGAEAKDAFGYGDTIATKRKVPEALERRQDLAVVADVLGNDDPLDDYLAGASISRLMGERGATTEGDITRALGTAAMSFWEKIKKGFHDVAIGGLTPSQKKALLGVVQQRSKADADTVGSFLDNIEEQLRKPGTSPGMRRGLEDYRDLLVPRDMRDAHAKSRGRSSGGGSSRQSAPADDGSAAALPPTQIPEASRIAHAHNNPGNLKFAGQEGATQGEAAQDGGHWAKFESTDVGLEALRQQVLRDAENGLTVEEFIGKYAPPASNDTETYIKQAMEALKARPGDALAELDPYDVVRFIAKKESGTELPSQYEEEPTVSADEAAKRVRELMQKGNY